MKTYRDTFVQLLEFMREEHIRADCKKWTVSAMTLLMSFHEYLEKEKEYPYLPEITVLLR